MAIFKRSACVNHLVWSLTPEPRAYLIMHEARLIDRTCATASDTCASLSGVQRTAFGREDERETRTGWEFNETSLPIGSQHAAGRLTADLSGFIDGSLAAQVDVQRKS